MRILLVDIDESLVAVLQSGLGADHDVTVLHGDPADGRTVEAAGQHDLVIHRISVTGNDSADIQRATLGTWNLLTGVRPRRHLQLSSMSVFAGYRSGWAIDRSWYPRPTPDGGSLTPYLAELTARELCRARPIDGITLRLGAGAPVDAIAGAVLHAVRADQPSPARWVAVHVPGRERTTTGTPPELPDEPAPLRGIAVPERITVFGAGGPLAAAMVGSLAGAPTLLLTDTRPLADVAAGPPQSPGAPLPVAPGPPHREQLVDITDPAAVLAAADGADCLVNCAVLRNEPVLAFRVNVLGALHVMQAAVRHGIPRVLHTGPALVLGPHPYGNADDRAVGPDTPPHPGDHLYFLTKTLAQEICRVYAEAHRIACPALLFCGFVAPDMPRSIPPHPFSVSWDDSGRAMAAAVTVSSLPEPFPVVHVLAPSPHDRYHAGSAERVLGWHAQDRLDRFWYAAASLPDPSPVSAADRPSGGPS